MSGPRSVRCGLGLVALTLAACGGKPAARPRHDGGDAGSAAVKVGDAAAVADPGAAVIAGGTIAVTVQWPDAPAAMRASPGVTACATPRPPRATIAALHGVAGVVVMIDGGAGSRPPAPAPAPVRLTVRDCALSPRVAVVAGPGATLEVQAQDDAGHAIAIADLGPLWREAMPAEPMMTRARLPVWGHTVALPVPTAGVRRVQADDGDDAAYVVVTARPYAAVTGADGAAALERVPPGTHEVIAWLPPAGAAPAMIARGQATVVAGDRVELTLRLAP